MGTSAAPAADEFVITDADIARCAALLSAFDAAFSDLDARDDLNIRLALRRIAEAGSGMPLSSWAPYTRGGMQASERAWRWLAACARAAVDRGDNVLLITVAEFAVVVNNLDPDPDAAGQAEEIGLLTAPQAALTDILSSSVVSATTLDDEFVVAHFSDHAITADEARRRHAHMLVDADRQGQPVHAQARAVALSLLS